MLCSRFLRPPHTEKEHGRLYKLSEHAFKSMLHAYEWSLKEVLKHRRATMIITGLTLLATGYLFVASPKGFLPTEDTGQIFAFTEAQQGISFDSMKKHQQALAAIVREDPNVDAFMSSIGASGISVASNAGRMFIRLKPHSERHLSADEVIQELRPKVAKVPGIQMFMQNLPPIRIGGRLTKSLYQLTLQSPDTDELYKYSAILEARMSAHREL